MQENDPPKAGAGDRVGTALVRLAIAILFFLGAFSHGPLASYSSQADLKGRAFLGAHGRIAKAIVNGDGYSDPFVVRTGPTAWMPPVTTYVLAVVMKIAGENTAFIYCAIWLGQGAAAILWTTLVISLLRKYQLPTLIPSVFTAWALIANATLLFLNTHDPFMTVALSSLTIWYIDRAATGPSTALSLMVSGFFVGIALLTHPSVGIAATVVFLLFANLKHRQVGYFLIPILLVLLPWLVYCRLRMGGWVPVKSNAGFELWQSQVLDDDGLLDMNTMRLHPMTSRHSTSTQLILENGELNFVRARRSEAIDHIVNNPGDYVSRCVTRLIACHVWPKPFDEISVWNAWQTWGGGMIRICSLISCLAVLLHLNYVPTRLFWIGLTMCLLTSAPYMLISHMDRYTVAWLPSQLIIISEGVRCMVQSFPKQWQMLQA